MDPAASASAPPLDRAEAKPAESPCPPPPPYPGPPLPCPAYSLQPQNYGMLLQDGAGYRHQPYTVGQQYPAQQNPLMYQPTVFITQGPLERSAKDYLGYSIFTMLCCCMPLGIAALIYSISARKANQAGDRMAAKRHGNKARNLNNCALGTGLLLLFSPLFGLAITYLHRYI